MKRLAAMLTLAIPTVTLASGEYSNCINDATVIGLAAQFRDAGNSPQQAYILLTHRFSNFTAKVPDDILKGFINTAYFDRDAAQMSGEQIKSYEIARCVRQATNGPVPSYQPLE